MDRSKLIEVVYSFGQSIYFALHILFSKTHFEYEFKDIPVQKPSSWPDL